MAPTLLPQHQKLIDASGIDPVAAEARGYRSVTTKVELRALGFSENQCRVPALLIPVRSVTGETATYQIRPDEPRVVDGKPLKYETPRGSRMVLDVPTAAKPKLGDPKIPLFITEGARKADAAVSNGLCCVSLLGVWNWRGTNEWGGKTALSDWELVALNDNREIFIVFDSDVIRKPAVHAALNRLKAFLEQRGAKVMVIYLLQGPGGEKVGLDDFLAAGHTTQELVGRARPELLPLQEETSCPAPYRETPTGLVWIKMTQHGEVETPLTNFSARIVGDLGRDDGAEVHRSFEIEAKLGGRVARAQISAQQFSSMNWPIEVLGASAVVAAGLGLKDRAREAIQRLSGNVAQRTIYTHTGWRWIAEQWVYLHGGGPIGPIGPIPGVEVDLGAGLRHATLPDPPAGDSLREAVQKSLSMLTVAPMRITAPLYASTPRAVLGAADFSEHLAGGTGVGKSELAALVQQHFGAGMDARNLPGSWSSTGNALEELAFRAKDIVLVIDDFIPTGSIADVGRAHRDADRVMRAQGNHSARQRMRADGTLRPPRPPRGLIISTGEEVPRGQSLRARMLVLEMGGDLDWNKLTECQSHAASGVYAAATAGFIQWVASKYTQAYEEFRTEVIRLRKTVISGHRRTPTIVADLGAAFHLWLTYAREIGAITPEESNNLGRRAWLALVEAGEAQVDHQQAEEPVTRFLTLISAAIVNGRAHVAAPSGTAPESAEGWGWRLVTIGNEGATDWRPSGNRIGWVDGEHFYLEPEASYVAAQEMARNAGAAPLPNPKTLHKRLRERGLLASTEPGRGKLTVRRTLEGRRHAVLHLLSQHLVDPESAQSAQSRRSSDDTGENSGPISPEQHKNGPSKSAQGQQEELFGTSGTTLAKMPW